MVRWGPVTLRTNKASAFWKSGWRVTRRVENERVTKKCERRGKKFRVKPHREETARFCSRACHNAHQKEGNIKKECEECGKGFEVPPSQKNQRFCSKSCYLENLNGSSGRVELECDQCGKKF